MQTIKSRGYITLLISLCVIFAMSLIPATFVLYLIMDRESTSKSLQVSFIYWLLGYSLCGFFPFILINVKVEKAENGLLSFLI